jgi:L-lysine exporter family protein LysE/ArgO
MFNNITAIFNGAIFVIAIIAGVGPQNLNTITHGIKKNYSYLVASTCFLADAVLILFGALGLGVSKSSVIIETINIIGILFMLWYLLYKIHGLFQKHSKFKINNKILSKKQSVLQALALTLLNPLVFMDTIVIIGGNSLQYSGTARINFIIGALLGDFLWLFGLTSISRKLAHRLNKTGIWISLDIMTIIIMAIILYKTIKFVL